MTVAYWDFPTFVLSLDGDRLEEDGRVNYSDCSSCDGRVYSTKVKVQKARVHKFVGQIQSGLQKK